MNLKDFKAGVEYLARSTNQREKEPAPFLMQVGKDGRLSLVSGDRFRTYVWRTGRRFPPALSESRREGISSKLLVQTTKTLKGKDISVDFAIDDDALIVVTSMGGKVRLPYIEAPELLPPRLGGNQAHVYLDEGRLPELVKAFEATAEAPLTRGVQFLGNGERITVVATQERKAFITYFDAEIDPSPAPYKWGTVLPFWMPLRDATTNATLTFSQIGLSVRSGTFEAYTGYSVLPNVKDLREEYFPAGSKPEVWCVLDRKVLLGSIKAITPDDKTGTIDISRAAEGNVALSHGQQHVGIGEKVTKGKGWGRVGFSAEYMSDILNGMSGKEVIIAWHTTGDKPIGIKDTSRQGDTFLLAPRVKA